MNEVKGLFFDVGGTVFDWKNTAREQIQELANEQSQEIDSAAFANDWRGEMFKIHTQVRHGNLPWINIVMGAVIANAVYDAVGVRMHQLPMSPERVKAALGA